MLYKICICKNYSMCACVHTVIVTVSLDSFYIWVARWHGDWVAEAFLFQLPHTVQKHAVSGVRLYGESTLCTGVSMSVNGCLCIRLVTCPERTSPLALQ